MMIQPITSTPDLATPTDSPESADSQDSSGDGFATLLTALCAAPIPMTVPLELTEVAPMNEGMLAAAIDGAPPLVVSLPGDGLTNLNPAELTPGNTASLAVPADALATDEATFNPAAMLTGTATDAELLLQQAASADAIKSAGNAAAIEPDTTLKSAATANGLPGVWLEAKSEEAKAGQPLQTEAARRDLVSLASAMAETNRQTQPPLTSASLASFLAGRESGDESGAKQTSGSASASHTAQAFNLEMASVSNTMAGAPPSAGITGQIINPLLAASETLRHRETRTLRLNLQPQDLGQVEVQITRHAAGQFSARLSAEHEFARHALADGLGQLRAALEQAGLPVERLEVSIGPGLHFGSSGQTQNQSQSGSQSEPRVAATELLETERAVTSGSAANDRLLSLRA